MRSLAFTPRRVLFSLLTCLLFGQAAGQPAAPSVPDERRTLTTGVHISIEAEALPVAGTLALVARLPDDATYLPDTLRVDDRPFFGVREATLERGASDLRALIFKLPVGARTVSFDLTHRSALTEPVRSSLLVLTPTPMLLRGERDAVALYQQATPVARPPAPRVRTGAVILSPLPGTVVRGGKTIAVTADTVQGYSGTLSVNGVPVAEEQLGQRTLDRSAGRETFEFIGLPLKVGPNRLRFESRGPAGTLVDEVTVFLAGPPATLTLTPAAPLVADTATPLRFEVRVADAYGKAPADSFVTFEVDGTSFLGRDASAQGAGYQVRFANGVGVLVLTPVATPREIELTARLGRKQLTRPFVIETRLRPWIVSALGSVGSSYQPGRPFRFSAQASLFARGALGDYLVTVAAQTNPDAYGLNREPLDPFPVLGSAGTLSAETPSRHGIYARVERDLSYLQYGDFETDLPGLLFASLRSYTGLSARYAPVQSGFVARAYAALAASGDDVTNLELPSDGTSFYRLPGAPLRADSLQLEVIKRRELDGTLIDTDDDDPLVGRLQALTDYALNEETGLIQLVRPLPLRDGDGDQYLLRASYTVLRPVVGERVLQYGAQVEQALGDFSARAGVRQDTSAPGVFTRLISGGLKVERNDPAGDGRLEGDVEVTHGQNQTSGGLGAAAELRYETETAEAELTYEYLSGGYRSDEIDESSAGHTAGAEGRYDFSDALSARLDAQLSYPIQAGRDLLFTTELLGVYEPDTALVLGGSDLGKPTTQAGVELEQDAFRLLGGVGLRDLAPLAGGDVSALHHQGLAGATSITDFSVAYQLTDFLSLRVTDELEWGVANRLFVGLDSNLENSDLAALFCTRACSALDDTDLGSTSLLAQYEIPERVADEVSRLRFGLRSRYPVTNGLSVEASAEQERDVGGPSTTVFGIGSILDQQDYDIDARYELSLAPDSTKHTFSAGSSFAVNDELFGALNATYLNDSAETPASGLALSASAAYRGHAWSVLTNHEAELGSLSSDDGADFYGDTQLSVPFGRTTARNVDLRFGYTYRYRPTYGFQDRVSLGSSLSVWDGGAVVGYARLFHDWPSDLYLLGGTLELSQRMGCGLYLAGGYNLTDESYEKSLTGVENNPFGQRGFFIRLDAVVDETWRCGPVGFKTTGNTP